MLRLVGSGLYLVGTMLVTIVGNVPQNDALAAVDAESADGAAEWAKLVPGWTRVEQRAHRRGAGRGGGTHRRAGGRSRQASRIGTGLHPARLRARRSQTLQAETTRTAEDPRALAIHPFRIGLDQADIDDLRDRLARARWPEELSACWLEPRRAARLPKGDSPSTGDPATTGAWPRPGSMVFPSSAREIDGQTLHFCTRAPPSLMPCRSSSSTATPAPSSNCSEIIDPLTDPRSHGGNPAAAFHMVAPSLPGFGFSVPVGEPGWDMPRIRAFAD